MSSFASNLRAEVARCIDGRRETRLPEQFLYEAIRAKGLESCFHVGGAVGTPDPTVFIRVSNLLAGDSLPYEPEVKALSTALDVPYEALKLDRDKLLDRLCFWKGSSKMQAGQRNDLVMELRAKMEEAQYSRPPLRAFTRAMEARLRENDHKGDFEDGDSGDWLLSRLRKNLTDLETLIGQGWDHVAQHGSDPPEEITRSLAKESADVANYALMTWYHFGNTWAQREALDLESYEQGGDRG